MVNFHECTMHAPFVCRLVTCLQLLLLPGTKELDVFTTLSLDGPQPEMASLGLKGDSHIPYSWRHRQKTRDWLCEFSFGGMVDWRLLRWLGIRAFAARQWRSGQIPSIIINWLDKLLQNLQLIFSYMGDLIYLPISYSLTFLWLKLYSSSDLFSFFSYRVSDHVSSP